MADTTAKRTRAAKTADAADAPAAPAFDFSALAVEEVAALPKKNTSARDLPLLPKVEQALADGKPKRFPNVPNDAVKALDNQLRTCGRRLGCKLEIRLMEQGDGTTHVFFAASPDRTERKYTVEDVRAWARGQQIPEELLMPRVRREVTDAYREAHGYTVRKRK